MYFRIGRLIHKPIIYNRLRCFSSYPPHDLVGMPALSPTMEAGTVGQWLIKEGESFSTGDAICEIETDKAAVTFDATDDGYLAKILAGDSEIKVGDPLMILVEEEEDIGAFKDYVVETSNNNNVVESSSDSSSSSLSSSQPSSSSVPSPIEADPNRVVRLSPAARHMLESKSIDPSNIVGTSRHGIISKGDVILAIKAGTAITKTNEVITSDSAATNTPSVPSSSSTLTSTPSTASNINYSDLPPVNDKYEDIPNSNMRKVIAKRLTESKATVPHSYTSIECEIDALLSFRKKLKSEMDINVSVNDMVIKSAALALRDVPEANGKWNVTQKQQVKSASVDISVAVATPTGLITPIVTDADKRGVQNINSCVKDLATRARDGKLKPEEYQGGSFTISNLGMFGISNFSAVINPPQACILAVGGGVPRVLPGDDQPRVATTLTVELSADRRVVDDAIAAQYLRAFKHYLSSPAAILL